MPEVANGASAPIKAPSEKEAMASAGDGRAALEQLTVLCDAMREDLAKATELKKTSPNGALARNVLADGSLSLLELKEVNRTVWELIGLLKMGSHAANMEVDAAGLKLQNLQYEKNYFLREVRAPSCGASMGGFPRPVRRGARHRRSARLANPSTPPLSSPSLTRALACALAPDPAPPRLWVDGAAYRAGAAAGVPRRRPVPVPL